eukprot:g5658.t1
MTSPSSRYKLQHSELCCTPIGGGVDADTGYSECAQAAEDFGVTATVNRLGGAGGPGPHSSSSSFSTTPPKGCSAIGENGARVTTVQWDPREASGKHQCSVDFPCICKNVEGESCCAVKYEKLSQSSSASSSLAGCTKAQPYCEGAALGVYLARNAGTALADKRWFCDDACRDTAAIASNSLGLFIINIIDMALELTAMVIVLVVFMLPACTRCKERKEEDFFQEVARIMRDNGITMTLIVIAWFDVLFQIGALGYAIGLSGASKTLLEATCFNFNSDEGLKHHETLTKLNEAVGTATVLGGRDAEEIFKSNVTEAVLATAAASDWLQLRAQILRLKDTRCTKKELEDLLKKLQGQGAKPADIRSLRKELSTLTALTAKFDYARQNSDELSFKKGVTIEVIDSSDPDWWRGRLSNGTEGLFPRSYCEDM